MNIVSVIEYVVRGRDDALLNLIGNTKHVSLRRMLARDPAMEKDVHTKYHRE